MKHRQRLWIILGLAALPFVGCGASSSAAAATAPFVYVANTKRNEISQYSASASHRGALEPLTPATVRPGRSRTGSPST